MLFKNYAPIKTACFTGHRELADDAVETIDALLESAITELCDRGVTTFLAGGAQGFDTLAALKVLDMKARFPQIRLKLILPCRNQTEQWGAEDVGIYQYILSRADDHRFLFESYVEGCMQERDRCLVEEADACIAFCERGQSGTSLTLTAAANAGIDTVNLYDYL